MVKFKAQWNDVKRAFWAGIMLGFIFGLIVCSVVHR